MSEMSPLKNYEQLKQVIQAANPDFNKRLMQVNVGAGQEMTVRDENIRLADVLLAVEASPYELKVRDDGRFIQGTVSAIAKGEFVDWNLKEDSLDWHYHNRPETVQLLIELLCQK